jgi:hypothetical protein
MIPDTRSYKLGLAHRGCSYIAVACYAAVLAAGCGHKGVPMTRSLSVGLVAPPANTAAMERAIETALARRHWSVKEKAPGKYTAHLDERSHAATVAVVYDATNVRIDYVDSTNLAYENGPDGELIHRNYNNWVKNLANDIRVFAAQAPPPAAPAPAPSASAPAPR